MPTVSVKTIAAKQIWSSPDGQRVIYQVELDYQGKRLVAKTYSRAIATEGWSGTVDSYEKQGQRGSETFVKQPPKEQASYGSQGGSKGDYQPKDEAAIRAMFAIKGAISLMPEQAKSNIRLEDIEANAQALFLMINRVKVVTEDVVYTPDETASLGDLFPDSAPSQDTDSPWPNS